MHKFPYDIIDLTHTLNKQTLSWSGGCGFRSEIKLDYSDCSDEVKFRVQQMKMHGGIGTHIDAPAHCVPGGTTIDQLLLHDLITSCVVIDVSELAHERYSVSTEDIINFEKTHGVIQPNSCVMIRTGWEKFWDFPDQYHNNHIFPSVSKETVELLMEKKNAGLGIDTLSPDRPESGYPVHALLLGSGKYILENVAHLEKLPPTQSFVLPLPIKVQGLTESPIRLIGLIPHSFSRE